MTTPFTRRYVEFSGEDGVLLRGWLFTPTQTTGDPRLYPGIVMTHGYGAVKELYLDRYAQVFAQSAFVVLLYDHPNFGESYSGGHVLAVSALDKRVKCVVSQMPSINGKQNLKRQSASDEDYRKLLKAFERDRKQRTEGGTPRTIPIIRPEEQQDWWQFFDVGHAAEDDQWRYRNWKNEQTLRSVELYGEYNPEEDVGKIAPCPLLMLVAEQDAVTFSDDEIELFETEAICPDSTGSQRMVHEIFVFAR